MNDEVYIVANLEHSLYQRKDNANEMIETLQETIRDIPRWRAFIPRALMELQSNLESEGDLTKVRLDNIKKVKDFFGIIGGKRRRKSRKSKRSMSRKN